MSRLPFTSLAERDLWVAEYTRQIKAAIEFLNSGPGYPYRHLFSSPENREYFEQSYQQQKAAYEAHLASPPTTLENLDERWKASARASADEELSYYRAAIMASNVDGFTEKP